MELNGTIKMIDETKSFGANGFRKREFVITTAEQYPQHILLELTQDKCDLLNNGYKVGDSVTVGINIRGREFVNPQGETKYFNSIQAWKINKDENAQPAQASTANDQFQPATNTQEEDFEDLPFN